MRTTSALLTLLVGASLGLFGCASGHPHEHDAHHHHMNMSPELTAYHEVLKPVWHSDPGAVRAAKACESSAALVEKAKGVGDADLSAKSVALDESCKKEGKPEVEAKLSTLHDRFHELMEGKK